MSPLLEACALSHVYPDGSVGLDGCSLTIRSGSRNALLGSNGSGKTSLLQHFNALLRPTAGGVRFAGQPVDYSRGGRNALRRRVGLVFQNPDRQLFSASVIEDVSFGPLNLGLDMDTVRQRVKDALSAVRMAEYADRPVHNLSFGQKKRVCIAGVLAMEPQLLILDEPMAGLDHAMRQELLAVFDHLHSQDITLLLATHDIDFAYRWADRIHVMTGGQCTAAFDATDFPDNAHALAAADLPVPGIIDLHRQLVTSGHLNPGTSPRSIGELTELIKHQEKGAQ